LAQNAPETAWRPGSARTHWGSLSAPPDPLAAVNGLGPPGGGGKREGKEGRGEGRRKGREGRREKGREGKEGELREEVHNLRKTTPRHQMAGYGPEVVVVVAAEIVVIVWVVSWEICGNL